jgi:CBS domain containing-hemolysin-like protein
MIPISDVVAVPKDTPIRAAIRRALDRQIYRLPVVDGGTSNIVGLFRLNAWEFLTGKHLDEPVEQAMQPVFFAPTTQPLSTLLPELLRREDQLVVVVDEYGSAVGIITLNDVVQDVLGTEERLGGSGAEPLRARDRVAEEDGSFVLDPHLPMVDFNELVDADLPTGEALTLAGFLLSRFQRLPVPGDSIDAGGYRFSIEAANDRTITSVRVTPD